MHFKIIKTPLNLGADNNCTIRCRSLQMVSKSISNLSIRGNFMRHNKDVVSIWEGVYGIWHWIGRKVHRIQQWRCINSWHYISMSFLNSISPFYSHDSLFESKTDNIIYTIIIMYIQTKLNKLYNWLIWDKNIYNIIKNKNQNNENICCSKKITCFQNKFSKNYFLLKICKIYFLKLKNYFLF